MLTARRVAIVGASSRPGSFGERMVTEALRSSTTVQLVNPRYDRIGDLPCAPDLKTLDETPDLVLFGVPDEVLIDQFQAAADIGAPAAVIFGSAHGDGMRQRIADTATAAGMAVCGAGCMGFINNVTGVRALGYLEPNPLPIGPISLVTHSGSAFSTLLRTRRGFGFRLAVSSGQELVTDTADYVEYACADPGTELIALLLETPRATSRLRSALLCAAEQGVPVIILTVGGSARGRELVAAHSGALAGDAGGWSAFCAATGAIRTTDLAEFTDTIELFAAGRRAGPGGRGIATVHDSGAERALCADIAEAEGVPFADLSAQTLSALDAILDDGLVAANPLDVWGTGADTRSLFGRCLRAISTDPAVAATALAIDLVTEYDGDTAYTDAVLDVYADIDRPLAVLASVPSAIDQTAAHRLRSNGVPVLEGMRSGLSALKHFAVWPQPVTGTPIVDDPARAGRWRELIATDTIDPFLLLADYGIHTVDSQTAATLAEVLHAARDIGYPVALKSAGVQHKTEVDGVVLNIGDELALTEHYRVMTAKLGPLVMVSAMARPGIEISVGVIRDNGFGPLLVVAAGGTTVEVMADRVIACPPVSDIAARALLDSLRIAPLLYGWRGAAAVDIPALVATITGFSSLAAELGDSIDAVEANPVIAGPEGAVAVDVLVIPRAQKIE